MNRTSELYLHFQFDDFEQAILMPQPPSAPRIPFYHAEEASNAIKSVMGEHYRSDVKTPFLWAFWKNYTSCRFVEEKDAGSGIYFFGKK